jgi:hypothetical protein
VTLSRDVSHYLAVILHAYPLFLNTNVFITGKASVSSISICGAEIYNESLRLHHKMLFIEKVLMPFLGEEVHFQNCILSWQISLMYSLMRMKQVQ